jgi:hypothetical protein
MVRRLHPTAEPSLIAISSKQLHQNVNVSKSAFKGAIRHKHPAKAERVFEEKLT